MEDSSSFFAAVANSPMSLVLMVGLLMLYFVPSYVAYSRRLKQTASIFVFNLFFGWTILGWGLALSLALWPYANAPAKDAVEDLPNLYIPSGNDKP